MVDGAAIGPTFIGMTQQSAGAPRAPMLLALLCTLTACGDGERESALRSGPAVAGPVGSSQAGGPVAPPPVDAGGPGAQPTDAAAMEAGAAGAGNDAGPASGWNICGQLGGGRPSAIVLSGDGTTMALLHAGGPVVLARVADQHVIRTVPWERKEVVQVLLSHDGALVALSLDSRLRVEQVGDGTLVFESMAPLQPRRFSADGQQLLALAGLDPPQVQLWNLATGKLEREFPGEATDAVFAPGNAGGAIVVHGPKRLTTYRA